MMDGQVFTTVIVNDGPTVAIEERQDGPPWGTGTPPWGTGAPPWASGRPGRFKCPGEDGDNVSIPPEYRSYLPPWCDARWESGTPAPATSTKAGASTTISSSNSAARTPSAQRTTFSTASITSTSQETLPPTDSPPAGSGQGSNSKAWVAGPAVGSIAGVALIFGFGFILWRRRHRKQAAAIAELEAEAEAEKAKATRPETVYEMEGSSPIGLYAEKPANEAPARELVS